MLTVINDQGPLRVTPGAHKHSQMPLQLEHVGCVSMSARARFLLLRPRACVCSCMMMMMMMMKAGHPSFLSQGVIQCTSCPLLILKSAHSVFFLPLFFSQIIFDNVEMHLFSRTIRFNRV